MVFLKGHRPKYKIQTKVQHLLHDQCPHKALSTYGVGFKQKKKRKTYGVGDSTVIIFILTYAPSNFYEMCNSTYKYNKQ